MNILFVETYINILVKFHIDALIVYFIKHYILRNNYMWQSIQVLILIILIEILQRKLCNLLKFLHLVFDEMP